MKRRKINNDIHTNTKGFSLSLRLLRKGLKVLSQIAPGIAVKVVTKMFLKPSRKKIGEKQQLFYNDGITDTLKIEGHKVKVLRKGSGKSVLIIHGWGSYGYDMKHVANALVSQGYQAIIPDLPCHGRSSGTFIEQVKMAKVIKHLILHYNAKSPLEDIVTHSWGGTSTLLALDMMKKGNYIGFNLRRMVSVSMPTRLDAIMNIFCKVLGLTDKVKAGLLKEVDKIAQSDDRTVEEVFPMGLNGLLENLKFDYLMIHGKKDRAISYANTVRLAGRFPQIRTQLQDKTGHINILMRKVTHDAIVNHIAGASVQLESIAS